MLAEEEITRLAHDIMKAKKVIALSGAGMSVESNIASFRGKGGLWEKYDPEEYAHISTLRHRPEKAWILLSAMQKEIAKARPNAGHRALAELEQMGMLQTIITQNVDGLHHLAGNTDIIEFHGNLQTVTCMDCGNHLPNSEISLDDIPPRCTKCKGVFKPDCVFFGEAIPADALTRAHQESRTCDLMLVLGTSAVVYPAASMPEIAKSAGAQVVEINPSETPLTRFVSDYILLGPTGQVLPQVVDKIKQEKR